MNKIRLGNDNNNKSATSPEHWVPHLPPAPPTVAQNMENTEAVCNITHFPSSLICTYHTHATSPDHGDHCSTLQHCQESNHGPSSACIPTYCSQDFGDKFGNLQNPTESKQGFSSAPIHRQHSATQPEGQTRSPNCNNTK